MEGLGAAASAIAVVSVAIQLAENAKRLYNFWQAIGEAPASIRSISTDLNLLSSVLAEIASHEQNYGPSGTVTDVLESCTGQIQDMILMTSKLEAGFDSPSRRVRKWSAFKSVFKEEKIAKFRTLLLQTKTTLVLARQTLSDRSIHRYLETNGQTMAILSKSMANLQLENTQTSQILSELAIGSIEENLSEIFGREIERMTSEIAGPMLRSGFQKSMEMAVHQFQSESLMAAKTQVSKFSAKSVHQSESISVYQVSASIRPQRRSFASKEVISTSTNMFGTVVLQQLTMATRRGDDAASVEDQDKTQHSFFFRPSPWLIYFGLAYELRFSLLKNSWGWRHQFQTFQPVSDDSLIFEFCAKGNVEGVKELLARKEASVWNVNSRGWTPLHFAAHEAHPDICKLLLLEGADITAVTYNQTSCCNLWCHSLDHTTTAGTLSSAIDFMDRILPIVYLFSSQIANEWGQLHVEDKLTCSEEFCGSLAISTQGPGAYSDWLLEREENMLKRIKNAMWESAMKALAPELQSFAPEEMLASCLWFVVADGSSLETCRVAIAAGNGFIDARLENSEGYSAIFASLIYRKYEQGLHFASLGADLHAEGLDLDWSPIRETPTSLALYTSDRFFEWRKMLATLSVDMETFIKFELQKTPLKNSGWTVQSLQALFDMEYTPEKLQDTASGTDAQSCECIRCPDCVLVPIVNCCMTERVMVEISWQRLLGDLRGDETSKGGKDEYIRNSSRLTVLSTGSDTESESCLETSKKEERHKLDDLRSDVPDGQALWSDRGSNLQEDLESRYKAYYKAQGQENQITKLEPKAEPSTIQHPVDWQNNEHENESHSDVEREERSTDETSSSADDSDESAPVQAMEPKWLCVYCWHRLCGPPPKTAPDEPETSEHDPDDDDSPFLFSIPA